MTDKLTPRQSNEPSIWDFVVEKLKFRAKDQQDEGHPSNEVEPVESPQFPWLSLLTLIIAIFAQLSLEPTPNRTPVVGVILYVGAVGCLVGAIMRGEWQLPAVKADTMGSMKTSFRIDLLLVGVLLVIFSFILFGNGQFGWLNTSLWILAIIFTLKWAR